MFKKLFLITLTVLLALTIVSCGGNSNNNAGGGGAPAPAATGGAGNDSPSVTADPAGDAVNTAESSDPAVGAAAGFFDMFSGGNYHMKAVMTIEGIETTMETYAKDDMVAMIMDVEGISSRTLVRDDMVYIISDESKTYMTIPVASDGPAVQGEDLVTAGMKPTGSGRDEFNGRTLPYEEYSDEDGNTTQFFMDGATLAGTRSIIGGIVMEFVIISLDNNIPAGVFDLPAGYEGMDFSTLLPGM